jgi:hypothetical protein
VKPSEAADKAMTASATQRMLFWLQGHHPAHSARSDRSISEHPGSGGRRCYHC